MMMQRKIIPKSIRFKRWALLGGLIAACLFLGVALAAGEQLSRQVIDSGGGPVGGGNVHLQTAIGQPVAGPVRSGDLGLCSGFLCGSTAGTVPSPNSIYLPLVMKN